jgi:SAM-dependent methyltransferase
MKLRPVDTATNLPAVYEGLGWFYDRYWRGQVSKAMPGLDRLVLPQLPRHSRVLDLCRGTGHICSALARRGFRVTGLDGSEDMLRFARENAPGCDFVAAHIRNFSLPGCFNAVLSTFDSMKHLLSLFDLNLAEAFIKQCRKSSTMAAQVHLCYVRKAYESETKLGVTETPPIQPSPWACVGARHRAHLNAKLSDLFPLRFLLTI